MLLINEGVIIMARQLKPQRTTTPTQNDIMRALASVDALIVAVEELREWQVEVNATRGDENNEVIAAFEKQFEQLFTRLNKIEAKVKELDKKVNGKKATSSPLKAGLYETANLPTDGDTDVE